MKSTTRHRARRRTFEHSPNLLWKEAKARQNSNRADSHNGRPGLLVADPVIMVVMPLLATTPFEEATLGHLMIPVLRASMSPSQTTINKRPARGKRHRPHLLRWGVTLR